jgi:gamma-glutamylcyclotransferase (GGCT)/AIG2-like uncharacterized protein YtfP
MTTITRLFIYGTLLDPEIQQHIIGRIVPTIPAELDGFVKGEINLDGNVYPRIEPMNGETVMGAVVELTEMELAFVDHYEGTEYTRQTVTLSDGTQADVYVKPS